MFYTRIKELCKVRGIAVTNMLKDLGLSTGNTGAWKQGKLPTGEILSRLAEYLDTSIDYLVNGTYINDLTADEKQLLEIYRSVPEKARYKVLCDFERLTVEEKEKLIKLKLL